MAKIAEKAASLKKGAIFITFTRRLPSTHFEVLEHEMYQMSWGGATVYIQQKTTEPVPAADLVGPPPGVCAGGAAPWKMNLKKIHQLQLLQLMVVI
ncbi:unnamed protein product [Heterosigma akashiwo]